MNVDLVNTYKALRGHIGAPGAMKACYALEAARNRLANGGRPGTGRPTPAGAYPQRRAGESYFDNPGAFGFRLVGFVSPDGRRWGNAGWQYGERAEGFCTSPFGDYSRDGDGLVWGAVYQLPARHGRARFVAAYVWGHEGGNGATLDLSTVWEGAPDDNESGVQDNPGACDAAREANRLADSNAEREREYQSAWQCGNAYGDALEAAKAARVAFRDLVRERRRAKAAKATAPAICAAIDKAARGYLAEIKKAKATAGEALDGRALGLWVSLNCEDSRGAFLEAAGLKSFPEGGVA